MIDVCCALIKKGEQILATQRSHGMHLAGKWEFPGGKVEKGESAEVCIVREIAEELDLVISPVKALISVSHHYPDKAIHLIPFLCEIESGKIVLNEHSAFSWLDPTEILNLDWAAADRKIIKVNMLGSNSLKKKMTP